MNTAPLLACAQTFRACPGDICLSAHLWMPYNSIRTLCPTAALFVFVRCYYDTRCARSRNRIFLRRELSVSLAVLLGTRDATQRARGAGQGTRDKRSLSLIRGRWLCENTILCMNTPTPLERESVSSPPILCFTGAIYSLGDAVCF